MVVLLAIIGGAIYYYLQVYTNPKTIYQCPTEVKITKTTTELNNSSDEEKKLIYEELQKLTFNILS